ncbi:MAG TPA: hypothetical protein DCQ51_16765, partial [Planktothrix sp. UBA8407]|nr:hypothetical protein [Planktothrix sp. UBA8407]HBK23166.1 hypothetical protein [Planktothrix sp. UBA10369]
LTSLKKGVGEIKVPLYPPSTGGRGAGDLGGSNLGYNQGFSTEVDTNGYQGVAIIEKDIRSPAIR